MYNHHTFTLIARIILAFFLIVTITNAFLPMEVPEYEPTVAAPDRPFRIIVLPLDSRPPCRDYPEQLASIAGIEVLLPPPGYLDYYRTPADRRALAEWFRVVGPTADAVILSTDILIHGGLMASRIPKGNTGDAAQVLTMIELFHTEYSKIPIYAFSIIPRLLIADTPENQPHKQAMAEFSVLMDKIALTPNDENAKRLAELAHQIPQPLQTRYTNMYADHTLLSIQLVSLAEKGVLRHVVLGQDDAQTYGMANAEKRTLQHIVNKSSAQRDSLTLTRGTDEVAASLIAHIVAERYDTTPRVFVQYSWPGAAQVIMPYMPSSVEQTVEEKLRLSGAVRVHQRKDANFVLYVHIGTPTTSAGALFHAAYEVKQLLQNGHTVALVDLSETYDPTKNLFPYLELAQVDIARLASYAGWNTTSNSIGTAVAHAAIRYTALTHGIYDDKQHYAFLFQRFLDDWYYQKQVQSELNSVLGKREISPTNLGSHYGPANEFVQKKLAYHANILFNRYFAAKPCGQTRLKAYKHTVQLPWPRTFEVQVDVTFTTGYSSLYAIFERIRHSSMNTY